MIAPLSAIGLSRPWLNRHLPMMWRLLIIAGVLAATAFLSRNPSERRMAILVAVVVTLVFWRWPPLGLVAIIGAAMVVPFAIGTGTESSLNAAVLLVALLVGLWMLRSFVRRDLHLVGSRPIVPLIGFLCVALLSFFVGLRPLMAFVETAPLRAQFGGLAIFCLSVGAFLLVAHQVRDARWLQVMSWLFLALGAFDIFGRLIPEFRQNVTLYIIQPGADGSLFWVWLVALAFSQAVYNRDLKMPWRLALGCLTVATLYHGMLNNRDWVSGWLPALVGIVVILWAATPRLGFALTLVGGAFAVMQTSSIIEFVMVGDNDYSQMTRLEAWKIMAELIAINPIFGLGPANYYWYTPQFSILGWNVQFNSHNNFIDIAAQTGLLGLAFFTWFLCAVGWLGWSLRSRVPAGFSRAYVYGAVGGFAGTVVAGMLGDWVLPFAYNVGVQGFRASVIGWLFLGGLVALEMIARRDSPTPGDQQHYRSSA
jgi:O-antigen ligase